jgi:hypothetical protein
LRGYYEQYYESWDCSTQGFEGVRSQDILPLLLERFHFHLFIPYGNVIDPFIDRAFGAHFDPAAEWDRAFIDQVHRRDEDELASGRLKPTHALAIVSNQPSEAPRLHLLPQSCVRLTAGVAPRPNPQPPYEWNSWPHDLQSELDIACRRLADTGQEIRQRTEWALDLSRQLDERTAWALSLEEDLQARTDWGLGLQRDVEDRTKWACSLQTDADHYKALAQELNRKVCALEEQVEERTAWALRLKSERAEQAERAERLESEMHRLLHNPLHLASRLLTGVRNQAFRWLRL